MDRRLIRELAWSMLAACLVAGFAVADEHKPPLTDSWPWAHVKHRDGLWSSNDEAGQLVARGEYRGGRRQGKWTHWHKPGEGDMFASAEYEGFQTPFHSEAEFVDDKLHGAWQVFDAKKRLASSFEFAAGELHGTALWNFPDGQPRRQAQYQHGRLSGGYKQWNDQHELVISRECVAGRPLRRYYERHKPDQPKCEGAFLLPGETTVTTFDWWRAAVQVTLESTAAAEQRYGTWTWWYPNGQQQMRAIYEDGLPNGTFTWWHENGQKRLEGRFVAGQQQGKFLWWYPTGRKELEGQFTAGVPSGPWTRWDNEGRVIESGDVAAGDEIVAPEIVAVPPLEEDRQVEQRPETVAAPAPPAPRQAMRQSSRRPARQAQSTRPNPRSRR